MSSIQEKVDEMMFIQKFLDKFIVPNFYRKEHFYAMEGWSDEKLANFKKYMTDRICWDDSVVEIVNGLIVDFEEEIEDPNSKYAETQDDFTNRMCENRNCNKEFDLSDPHYYDEEQCVCYCSEECYKNDTEEDDIPEKYCECSFPKFIINDGYQSCRCCGLLDHYKGGKVAEWSDDDSEDEDEDPKTKPCSCGCEVVGGSCEEGRLIDNGGYCSPVGEDSDAEECDDNCKTCGLRFYDILLTNKEKHGDWCHCDAEANKMYDLLAKAEDPAKVLAQAAALMLKELDKDL